MLPSKILESGWCQNSMARGKGDNGMEQAWADSETAVRWCPLGAMLCSEVRYGTITSDERAALKLELVGIIDRLGLTPRPGTPYDDSVSYAISYWNDNIWRKQDEVVRAMKEAERKVLHAAE